MLARDFPEYAANRLLIAVQLLAFADLEGDAVSRLLAEGLVADNAGTLRTFVGASRVRFEVAEEFFIVVGGECIVDF